MKFCGASIETHGVVCVCVCVVSVLAQAEQWSKNLRYFRIHECDGPRHLRAVRSSLSLCSLFNLTERVTVCVIHGVWCSQVQSEHTRS